MAKDLAARGHNVFASTRDIAGRNAANSSELRILADNEHLSLNVVELDLTDSSSVDEAVTEVIERAGRIDVLINNAGNFYPGLIETFDVEEIQQHFNTKLFGVVRMNRAVVPHMRRQASGLLVYISSVAGRRVVPLAPLYSAGKFALEALAEGYHYQLHKLGIDSVIIQPGQYPSALANNSVYAVDTERAAEYREAANLLEKSTANMIPQNLSADAPDPQEVGDAVAAVITTPSGDRPLRVAPGEAGEALKMTNEIMAEGQAAILEGLGLVELVAR